MAGRVRNSYACSGDVVDRWRGRLPELQDRTMFLDVTGDGATGWVIASASYNSGSGRVGTEVRGQNAVSVFAGSRVIDLQTDYPSYGKFLVVIDEGTPFEWRGIEDSYNGSLVFQVQHVLGDLVPGFHVLRVIAGVDKNAANLSTYYAFQHDALDTR